MATPNCTAIGASLLNAAYAKYKDDFQDVALSDWDPRLHFGVVIKDGDAPRVDEGKEDDGRNPKTTHHVGEISVAVQVSEGHAMSDRDINKYDEPLRSKLQAARNTPWLCTQAECYDNAHHIVIARKNKCQVAIVALQRLGLSEDEARKYAPEPRDIGGSGKSAVVVNEMLKTHLKHAHAFFHLAEQAETAADSGLQSAARADTEQRKQDARVAVAARLAAETDAERLERERLRATRAVNAVIDGAVGLVQQDAQASGADADGIRVGDQIRTGPDPMDVDDGAGIGVVPRGAPPSRATSNKRRTNEGGNRRSKRGPAAAADPEPEPEPEPAAAEPEPEPAAGEGEPAADEEEIIYHEDDDDAAAALEPAASDPRALVADDSDDDDAAAAPAPAPSDPRALVADDSDSDGDDVPLVNRAGRGGRSRSRAAAAAAAPAPAPAPVDPRALVADSDEEDADEGAVAPVLGLAQQRAAMKQANKLARNERKKEKAREMRLNVKNAQGERDAKLDKLFTGLTNTAGALELAGDLDPDNLLTSDDGNTLIQRAIDRLLGSAAREAQLLALVKRGGPQLSDEQLEAKLRAIQYQKPEKWPAQRMNAAEEAEVDEEANQVAE